MQVLMKDRNTC